MCHQMDQWDDGSEYEYIGYTVFVYDTQFDSILKIVDCHLVFISLMPGHLFSLSCLLTSVVTYETNALDKSVPPICCKGVCVCLFYCMCSLTRESRCV